MVHSLDKTILIAMPGMLDETFHETTVLICAHSDDGAMGLVLNRLTDDLRFPALVEQLDLWDSDPAPSLLTPRDCQIHVGGPVDPSRGFVLHSPDYFCDGSSVRITDDICLTATVDILRELATGAGPEHVLLALGYAAWSPGQLEYELQTNGWLHTEATSELVFSCPVEHRYRRAFARIGIDPGFLATSGGRA